MSDELKIGIVGLDTSHVVAFTKLLNDSTDPNFIPGAPVVAAFPSFSEDVESSVSRVEGYTKQLREEYGVEMVDSVEAVCERVDAVLLESVDGRRHLPEYRPIAAAGKPCFIDKPMTASLADALEIQKIAEESRGRVFSSSSLRMVPEVQGVLADPDGVGEIEQVHVFSPASLEPTNPGLYWYGVHGVEMLYTLMGKGCGSVTAFSEDKGDLVLGNWKDGRRATLFGSRLSRHDYGGVVHGSKSTRAFVCNTGGLYVPLVKSIVAFFKGAKAPVTLDTTVEMMAFIDAALRSQGDPIQIEV
jgi:predicted dehydrogenase